MHGLRTRPAWILLAVSCLLSSAPPASAQNYPSRYVRIITAGVGTFHDIIARNLGHRLNERWGQPVVIDNQAAAGLTIGTGMAAKAAPDGYTLLLGDRSSLAAAPSLYKSLRYDPVKDLVPITMVARGPAILVAHPSVPAGNLKEFIAYLRKQPDPVHFASSGVGTFTHLTGLLFEQLTDVKLLMVQYKGGGAASIAMLGGEAKLSIFPIPVVLAQVNAGTLKAFALTSSQRFDGAPAIPTGIEAGLPGLEGEQWIGMLAPAGTPDAIVSKLNRDIVDILQTPAFREVLQAQGAIPAPGTPAEFASFMASETVRLRKLIEASGLTMP